ncbi:hypothetical protein L9F63_019643, partial [Diploptera punctata]
MKILSSSSNHFNARNEMFVREVAPMSIFSTDKLNKPDLHEDGTQNKLKNNDVVVTAETLNSYNRDLNPVLKVLQFTGVFPFSKTRRGTWVYSPFSPLMFYAVCLYIAMLTILWFTTGAKLRDLMKIHRHFNVLFFVFMAVSYFLIILAIPVINWPEANRIANYLSGWTKFQEKYCKLTGRPLNLGMRKKVYILMLILPVLIFSFEVIYQLHNGDDVLVDWWVATKEWYLDVVRFYIITYWHLTCGALSSAARNLWRNFEREYEESTKYMPDVIDTHRSLWVELSRLVRETGTSMTYTYGFYILYMFLSLTFFVYHTISNLARQLRPDQILMALECCVMEYTLFLLCNSATNATREVGDVIRDKLLKVRWASNDTMVQRELDRFLKSMDAFPPIVSLGDYTIINRGLFIS